MIRRFFALYAIALIAFAASSCQKEPGPNGRLTDVSISVAMPELESKVISDGKSADIVYWAGFDENGNPVDGLNGIASVSGMHASFDVKLVKHYTYSFVFWAQDSDCKAYDLREFVEYGKVGVSYEGAANDESRDAFYKQEDITITSADEVKTIRLSRPFAQINFLAADYQSIEDVDLQSTLQSTVSIAGLPTVLNGLDGTVSGEASTSFTAAAVPADPAYMTVRNVKYGWYSMNYVLAGDEKKLNEVTASFTHGKSVTPIEVLVENVPYRRNHRTNIIGSFLTDFAEVKVVIMNGFDDPTYNVDEEGNPIL